MNKPIIGVMMSQKLAPQKSATHYIQFLNEPYINALERAGTVPLLLPLTNALETLDSLLQVCDGFLFPGGADVCSYTYGEDPSPKLGKVNPRMDKMGKYVLAYAIQEQKPVLGICRGMQLINAALGGTLYQDIGTQCANVLMHRQETARNDVTHRVTIAPQSRLAQVLGTEEVFTNTMHHQSVKKCAPGLQIVARTSDGIVEALEDREGLLLLVQWHPEELQDSVPCMRNLFLDLAQRAKKAAAVTGDAKE